MGEDSRPQNFLARFLKKNTKIYSSLSWSNGPKHQAVNHLFFSSKIGGSGEFHGVALTASGRVLRWGQEQGPEAPLRQDTKLKGGLRKDKDKNPVTSSYSFSPPVR